MAKRLRDASIAATPKQVHVLGDGKIIRNKEITEEEKEALLNIIDCIKNGKMLPAWCYRKKQEMRGDALLDQEGIMHLHLSPDHNDTLLYLVQYEKHVVLMCVAGHHFMDKPTGERLNAVHGASLTRREDEIDRADAEELERKKRIVKAGLLPRKPRPSPPPSD